MVTKADIWTAHWYSIQIQQPVLDDNIWRKETSGVVAASMSLVASAQQNLAVSACMHAYQPVTWH